jgi:hypothetical protein
MIEEDVFNALKGLVSNRCYPLLMPQNPSYPSIIYTRISSTPENTLNGGATIDLVRFQIDSYAETYSAARTLAASVRTAMEAAAFKGLLQTDQDFLEPDVTVYRVTQDYYVWRK